MRRWLALCMFFMLFGGSAAAQAPGSNISSADRTAIRSVIEAQIAAFRRDDAVAAFSFAAPGIKAAFQTPERFMEMVRTSYPQVYRPQTVAFGDLYSEGATLIQLVGLVGDTGAPVAAAYQMVRQPDGSWRINGCTLLRRPGRAT